MNSKKEAEVKVWEYFSLGRRDFFRERNDEDLKLFFEWSEQGKHKDRLGLTKCTLKNPDDYHSYANKLYIGKVWAGRTVHELWEDSFYAQDGSWPGLVSLIEDMPREVMEWVRKEIFAGQEAELIKTLYENPGHIVLRGELINLNG